MKLKRIYYLFKMHAFLILCSLFLFTKANAQDKGITNTTKSSYAKLKSVDMGAVHWTKGFWADRYKICKDSMIPALWHTYNDAVLCHSFKNFEIAAGLDTGNFRGPSFHDGDFYKTLEALAGMYASTKDKQLDSLMDKAIAVIAKAQTADGYIYTKAIIQQKKTGDKKMFDDKLSFEAYNFGHLMTAACVHYRATGKASLLDVARKATDFLIEFYNHASPEQARNAICPSHYMGIVEMYRTTHEKRYLDLVKKLIDIRGMSEGSDDNSDKVPFRQMKTVNGHAVRANYLFAGVADVYAETGDTSLLSVLNLMWADVVNHKMYITGGCGALYDGLSLEGLTYKPDSIQKIQQAYGKNYQLPNITAHNETCANIGNLLWNWRMLQLTADAKYADVIELELYNSILSGISLDGEKFFYTNPLAASDDFPYQLRWSGGRQKYIKLSNCCPPNAVRTIAEVNDYAYSLGENSIYVNLYAGSELDMRLPNGESVKVEQQTNYPWDGKIRIIIKEAGSTPFSFNLRIPGWADHASISVNGKPFSTAMLPSSYAVVNRQWKKGDIIELNMPMEVKLMESNPLVEETRNQVAVKRGPVVYCAESVDMPAGKRIAEFSIPVDTKWTSVNTKIGNAELMMLQAKAKWMGKTEWNNQLYKPVNANTGQLTSIKLVPYFAWANRGHSEMSVWLPLSR